MIPEVNNLINDLDNSTRDSSIMGAILHDVRHAKDLKQKPIHDKFNKAAQFSGYDSGYAAGEIVSEIVSWIGPAKLFKIAGGGKLVSRLAQMPKIQKGISYYKKARTMLANSHLGMLARESYGATKNFFTSRFGSLWDDFSRKKFAFVGLDKFRYGDDIGKHTARLYQSTGEGAEYQRISRGLYSEAAEHGDDVAKGVKEAGEKNATYPSTYDERINQTPVNNGSWTGDRGESKFISELDEVNDVLKKYDIDGIEYKDGIPDFSPVSEGEVIHPDMSIDRNKNFRVADELLAEQLGVSRKEITKLRKQGKFTWHELNDMKTMQLIPSILNSKFGHLGGVAEVKKLLGL
ncbi:hypothetical protein D8861_12045 [Streptococcus sanguinis]|nr:hypothetical protein D8873_12065 [Streptococcus sanguinis]RSI63585.1 hypothetical protein D8861_12045 [Streptococcus sanguinis]